MEKQKSSLHSTDRVRRLAVLSLRGVEICAFTTFVLLIAAMPCRGQMVTANPNKLTFSYTPGGAVPPNQTVSLSTSGAAVMYVVRVVAPADNWLAVSPARGTTPSTFTVSVTPDGLAPGTYQGTISLTPNGVVANLQNIVGVTLTVNGPGTPLVSSNGVVNASGHQAKLAPGALFAITGSSLGPETPATAATLDYPKSLGSTSVNFTPISGGSPVDALIKSASATQVVGLLPSSVAPGMYAVRVSYKGLTSDPQNVAIVARSFGAATINGLGIGPAQATLANVNNSASLVRFTTGSVDIDGTMWTLTPAHPGDTVELTGTGGGADPAADGGGTSGDQTAAGNFIVTAGDRQITPLYAGAVAGSPGLWKISFTLPPDITPDCSTAVQVSANGEPGNIVSIAVADTGQDACSDFQSSPAILSKLDAGGDIVLGAFGIVRVNNVAAGTTTLLAGVSGGVFRYTPNEWTLSQLGPKLGYCRVYDRTFPTDGKDPGNPERSLNAGPELPLGGPNLPANARLVATASPTGLIYIYTPPTAATIASGAYTLTGNGGSDVGAFSVSTNFPVDFTVTNWDSVTVITRSQPLTLSWAGSGFDQVQVIATTGTVRGASQHLSTITCTIPGNLGTYSIPAAALAYLEPTAANAGFSTVAIVTVTAGPNPTVFTAPLSNGGQIDIGGFGASLGVGKTVTVQ